MPEEEEPIIIWGEPPPQTAKAQGQDEHFKRFVEALQQRPDTWAEVPPYKGEHYTSNAPAKLRRMYPAIETTSRSVRGDDKYRVRVWARWPSDAVIEPPDLRSVQ